ncbi:MAG TPA: AMIN domain-containing protein, partial [Terriglobia bacterium]|nr:AMIN domain-containing protein [Terriglobia bacterium]
MRLTAARMFLKMTLGAALLAAAATAFGAAPAGAVVRNVEYSGTADTLDVRIDATGPARVFHFELENPRRLVLDFENMPNSID